MLRSIAIAFALLFAAAPASAVEQEPKEHKLVIQVSENDPAKMNLALNNAANVSKYYADKGEEIQVEIVAYGPGLHMLRTDTSPVKQRMTSFMQSMPNVAFAACGNTMDNMKKAEGKDIQIMSKIKVVPAGVTRLIELQEKGWSYVRP